MFFIYLLRSNSYITCDDLHNFSIMQDYKFTQISHSKNTKNLFNYFCNQDISEIVRLIFLADDLSAEIADLIKGSRKLIFHVGSSLNPIALISKYASGEDDERADAQSILISDEFNELN